MYESYQLVLDVCSESELFGLVQSGVSNLFLCDIQIWVSLQCFDTVSWTSGRASGL